MDGDLRVRITNYKILQLRALVSNYEWICHVLQNMVMSFRVSELQSLLAFAGKNKSGRKNELQARALELVKHKSNQVVAKMKELYKAMQWVHNIIAIYLHTYFICHNQH